MDDHVQGGEGASECGIDVKRRNPLVLLLVRSCFLVAILLGASFVLSILFGLLAFLIGSFSGPHSPVSVPAQCRVVSSSVDIRSSKVCELGLSNYKAKHVLYPSGNSRIWCHDDYYWASIFKVEYKEYFSGRTLHGVAESPKEALPMYCRPSFTAAWSTKSKFKVNETYECKYSLGTFRAEIYPDYLFNCQAEEPSVVEMMKRFFILFLNFISSFSWKSVSFWHHILAAATGTMSGGFSSLCLVVAVKIFQLLRPALSNREALRRHLVVLAVQLRRVCLLIAYVSAAGWLTLQYSKFIGLKQFFFDSNSGTARTR